MKKILFTLILLSSLCSCVVNSRIKEKAIVVDVKKCFEHDIKEKCKYIITVRELSPLYYRDVCTEIKVYTNTLYQIDDTVSILSK